MPEPIQEGQRSTVATNQNIENVQINLDCKVPWIIGPKKQETYLKDQGTYLPNCPKGLNWQNGQKPKVLQTVIAQRVKSKVPKVDHCPNPRTQGQEAQCPRALKSPRCPKSPRKWKKLKRMNGKQNPQMWKIILWNKRLLS